MKDNLPWQKVFKLDPGTEINPTWGYDKSGMPTHRVIPENEARELLDIKQAHEFLLKQMQTANNLVQNSMKENARLRKALEVFAKADNWFETEFELKKPCQAWVSDNEPWLIAQEALEGK